MLKQRILTACLLIPLTLAIMFFAAPHIFCLATVLLFLGAAWEWTRLMGLSRVFVRLLYLALILVVFDLGRSWSPMLVCTLAFIWWLLAILLIVRYPKGSEWWREGVTVRGFAGFIVLIPCWLMLNEIFKQDQGPLLLLGLFVLIWGADTGAYFAGKKWGKHKIAPLVSPGKTWEGVFGGLVISLLIALLVLWWTQTPLAIWPWGILLALVTVLFSVVGDLFESMLKRNVNLKDSGGLLPGHGGLLDRIDSLTAAVPIFVLGLLLLNTFF